MAATKMMFISLCLSVMICGSLSYRRYGGRGESPSDRMSRSCGIYQMEKRHEGKGWCNWKVMEKVAEWDFKANHDRYMRHLILKARTSGLCYKAKASNKVVEIHGACEAMEMVCPSVNRRYGGNPDSPRNIDTCWKLIQEGTNAPRAPGRPPVTTKPNAPGGGGGGRI